MLIDPFELKKFSKLHPYRLIWTGYSRLVDSYGRITQTPIGEKIEGVSPENLFADRGSSLTDTAVTSNQAKLLELAVAATERFIEPIVEIGSYRGVTTRQLALATNRVVYAVDPYIGYGGWEADLAIFKERVESLANVKFLQETSGRAVKKINADLFSLIFIDALHDFANTYFDFMSWGAVLKPGGLIALHDVDDFPGTNLVCRRIIERNDKYLVWGYCPNLAIFMKKGVEL